MDQIEHYGPRDEGLLQKLLRLLQGNPGSVDFTLPSDSLLSGNWGAAPEPDTVADVPEKLKTQIREEAILSIFNELQSSLRLLLYATEPSDTPKTAEEFHNILNMWRYELQDRVSLKPDTYSGAVERYEPAMEAAYTIIGRCNPGEPLRIKVPCWRLYGRVVVRGEAERLDSAVDGFPKHQAAALEALEADWKESSPDEAP